MDLSHLLHQLDKILISIEDITRQCLKPSSSWKSSIRDMKFSFRKKLRTKGFLESEIVRLAREKECLKEELYSWHRRCEDKNRNIQYNLEIIERKNSVIRTIRTLCDRHAERFNYPDQYIPSAIVISVLREIREKTVQ